MISTSATLRRSASPRVKQTSVFLIEGNRLLRDGLTALLGKHGLKVSATARNAAEALQLVAQFHDALVVLDASLCDGDSISLVKDIKALSPASKVIVMHLLPVHDDIVDFVRAGVSGFILKDASITEVVTTIRSVANGASVLPPLMTGTLFSHVAAHAATRESRGREGAILMTARERQVTALILEGLSNKEIAARLNVATHTIKTHMHNILEKLSLHTRLEVAAYAHHAGPLEHLPSPHGPSPW